MQPSSKITEKDSEHMHSDSSDPRPYFIILVRQIENSQQNSLSFCILMFITGFICMLNYGLFPWKYNKNEKRQYQKWNETNSGSN